MNHLHHVSFSICLYLLLQSRNLQILTLFFFAGEAPHYLNEKSPLLEMREEVNHVSYNDKHDRDVINSVGPLQHMNGVSDDPYEEYYEPEMVRKF